MRGMIQWQGRKVAFRTGESVASALMRAGVVRLGASATGLERGVFCGIGQCQNCLVMLEGRPVEACLTPCRDGMVLQPQEATGDDA